MRAITAAALFVSFAASAPADEPFWQPLVDDQTLLVAAAPVDAEAWSAVLDEAQAYGPVAAGVARSALMSLRKTGAVEVALLLGVPDLQSLAGPVGVVSVSEKGDPKTVAAQIKQLITLVGATQRLSGQIETLAVDNLLLIGTERTLRRYAKIIGQEQTNPRTDLADAMREARGDGAAAAIVLSPGPDTRRVIRELWPPLPAPWGDIDGPLVADGIRYAAGRLSLGGPLAARVDLMARDTATTDRLEPLASRAVAAAIDDLSARVPEAAPAAFALIQSLAPTRDGRRVSVTLRRDDPALERLLKEYAPAVVADTLERALRKQRMNQMKQLALAMHTFHDSRDHFPAAAAICDEQGQPLLSWRVAVLPFVEHSKLFKRFRLDEPWDSPHNLKLVEEMPDVFADPARRDLAAAGKTTYQVPVGPQTIFPSDRPVVEFKLAGVTAYFGEGIQFRDMPDGSSNTVMIVEVAAERAVPWTKPTDWPFDPAQPMAGLRQEGRKTFVTGWGDGHALVVQPAMDEQEFGKAVTRNGKESRDLGKW